MKKVIIFFSAISIVCILALTFLDGATLALLLFLSVMLTAVATFYLLVRHSMRVTSRAAQVLKTEGTRAYSSINLFFRMEKMKLYKGVKQFRLMKKKGKILMRLIEKRFPVKSLTSVRFTQEIDTYSQKIMQNLEQVVCYQESLSSVDIKSWQRELRRLQKISFAYGSRAMEELQQNLSAYEKLGRQCKELLAENEELLAQMDKAILALCQENDKVFAENSPNLMTGDNSLIHQFVHYDLNQASYERKKIRY